MGNEKIEITSHKVLAVEGKDECYFFTTLLKHIDITRVQIIDAGGKDRFKKLFPVIKNAPGFSEIKRLGFIRDAEDLPAISAFNSICSTLTSLELPRPPGIAEITSTTPNTGIYIMPDNQNKGMIEDLCLQSLTNIPAMKCILNFSDCYEKILTKAEKEKYNPSKAKLLSYLASKVPIVNALGIAAQKNFWDFNHVCFHDIKMYLRKLFGE